jgi:succinylarginine dihydrolase
MNDAVEINFDGIVGPTHHYGGLSPGNLASMAHAERPSNPKQAALQGLAKMKFLADIGVPQAVLPPHERPDVFALRRLGFGGTDARVLEAAGRFPMLLSAYSSASAMWAANAATVSPSADCADGRVHFTPANLATQFHRSLEAATTSAVLKAIFPAESAFVHHPPLPASPMFFDEGAANHMRLARSHGEAGEEIFVFGRRFAGGDRSLPMRFPARQSAEAAEAIARLHQLRTDKVRFVQQNPEAIDAGAFHNDVVAVAHLNVILYHERAFRDFTPAASRCVKVSEAEVPLADAVASYLFNSQIVSLPDGSMALIAPTDAQENPRSRDFLAGLPGRGTSIRQVHFVDVRQSMDNGGGPACLRLRVALNARERSLVNPAVFLTNELFAAIAAWIHRHYRDRLTVADLADPKLLDETRQALDELSGLLKLGSVYQFQ